MKLHELPKCHLPEAKHVIRQNAHIKRGTYFETSVREWNFNIDFDLIADKPMLNMPNIPMAWMYREMPFGATNTVEKAGCVCFIAYYILKDFLKPRYCNFSFKEFVDEAAKKGYRVWKFRDYPETFSSPKIDIEEVKKRFAAKVDLTCCNTEMDLIAKLGPVEHILMNLSRNYYVPLRVNNAIYHNDSNRTGGHYVTLYGVTGGMALVWDSSIGDVKLPFKTLMEAAIEDKGLIAIWDIE